MSCETCEGCGADVTNEETHYLCAACWPRSRDMMKLGNASARLDNASLTRAHVTLTLVETEMRAAGRSEAADAISYADLVILAVRNALNEVG